MKKIATVALLSLSLFVGAAAFAASSSLVGQKVQGLFTVKKDGVKIADAVIINGTAYAPVRAVAEAAGVDLSVSGKEIIMKDSATSASPANISDHVETNQPSATPGVMSKEALIAAIAKKQEAIDLFKEVNINTWESMIRENPKSSSIPMWQAALDRAAGQLQTLENELQDLQKQLAELQN